MGEPAGAQVTILRNHYPALHYTSILPRIDAELCPALGTTRAEGSLRSREEFDAAYPGGAGRRRRGHPAAAQRVRPRTPAYYL